VYVFAHMCHRYSKITAYDQILKFIHFWILVICWQIFFAPFWHQLYVFGVLERGFCQRLQFMAIFDRRKLIFLQKSIFPAIFKFLEKENLFLLNLRTRVHTFIKTCLKRIGQIFVSNTQRYILWVKCVFDTKIYALVFLGLIQWLQTAFNFFITDWACCARLLAISLPYICSLTALLICWQLLLLQGHILFADVLSYLFWWEQLSS
jgi:hypothetical protein